MQLLLLTLLFLSLLDLVSRCPKRSERGEPSFEWKLFWWGFMSKINIKGFVLWYLKFLKKNDCFNNLTWCQSWRSWVWVLPCSLVHFICSRLLVQVTSWAYQKVNVRRSVKYKYIETTNTSHNVAIPTAILYHQNSGTL